VILASVEPLASLFRGISTVATLAPQTISGSPERLSDAELATQARPILDDLYAQTVSQLRESFEQRRAQGRAIRDVAEAARAATFGMIETLLVDIDVVVPGTVDETDGRITLGEERPEQTYGVVDEIARRALLSGARVLGVRAADLPSEAGAGPLAATLRYPL
jgi:peptide subunit release factor 1 (eRF1)